MSTELPNSHPPTLPDLGSSLPSHDLINMPGPACLSTGHATTEPTAREREDMSEVGVPSNEINGVLLQYTMLYQAVRGPTNHFS